MGFLSPWFLGGLLALGIPFYLHLLRQHKSNPLPFSSLMFFEKRTQSSGEASPPEVSYAAGVALRVARAACFAVCQTISPRGQWAICRTKASGPRALTILSAARRNPMSDAKNAALDALRQFRAGDRGQVISFASSTQLLTQSVTSAPELKLPCGRLKPATAAAHTPRFPG